MNTKFTPGPWHVVGRTVYSLNSRNTNRFAAMVQATGTECASEEECLANAALISAAPDLYEALCDYVKDDFEMHGTTSKQQIHNSRLRRAEAALKKARGEA